MFKLNKWNFEVCRSRPDGKVCSNSRTLSGWIFYGFVGFWMISDTKLCQYFAHLLWKKGFISIEKKNCEIFARWWFWRLWKLTDESMKLFSNSVPIRTCFCVWHSRVDAIDGSISPLTILYTTWKSCYSQATVWRKKSFIFFLLVHFHLI